LLPKDQVSQPDNVQAMFIMGHGVNTITRMPEAVRAMEKLELLVVCDPYPTAWSVLSELKDGIYLLPACTSFEMDGSRRTDSLKRLNYFVQSFNADKGGNLKADAPIACKSATGALRTAERLALRKLGVVAFSSTGDPEMGDYDDEPTVIFRNGQFPAAFD
jgi:predicted molibdopterin-dependent oxidoreductase YjgC